MAEKKEKHEKPKAGHGHPAEEDAPQRSHHKKKSLTALKDHSLHFGDDYKREIKAGDDVSDVPEFLHDALRSEKVIS